MPKREDYVEALVNQSIDVQRMLDRLVSDLFGVQSKEFRSVELSYFALFIVIGTLFDTPRGDQSKERVQLALAVIAGHFEKSRPGHAASIITSQTVGECHRSFVEYGVLYANCFGKNGDLEPKGLVTLTMHFYERLMQRNARGAMLNISGLAAIVGDLFVENTEFVRQLASGDVKAAMPESDRSRIYDKMRAHIESEIVLLAQLRDFLLSDDLQNESYPPDVKLMVHSKGAVDEVDGAKGDFGRCIESPIPVNGPLGEVIYLSNLRTTSGDNVMFHRIGSIDRIDVFETVSTKNYGWDLLFLDMYHPRKSKKLPSGYNCTEDLKRLVLFFGVHLRVREFPANLVAAIGEYTLNRLGVALVPPEIELALKEHRFQRPQLQQEKINELVAKGLSFTAFRET